MRMRYIGLTFAAASALVLGSTAPAMAGEEGGHNDSCTALTNDSMGLVSLNVPIFSPSYTSQYCNNVNINMHHKKRHHHHPPTLG